MNASSALLDEPPLGAEKPRPVILPKHAAIPPRQSAAPQDLHIFENVTLEQMQTGIDLEELLSPRAPKGRITIGDVRRLVRGGGDRSLRDIRKALQGNPEHVEYLQWELLRSRIAPADPKNAVDEKTYLQLKHILNGIRHAAEHMVQY